MIATAPIRVMAAAFYAREPSYYPPAPAYYAAARMLRATSGLLRTLSGGKAATTPLHRGSRPARRKAAALLGQRILGVATQPFLTEGYGAITIEAAAQRARISKRTFCYRFPDKAALFGAVVRRIIEGPRPPAGTPLFEGGSLVEVLRRLARLTLRAVLTPMALSLNRLIIAEVQRFPELAAIVAGEGGRIEVVEQIALMLEREARAGTLAIDRPTSAAEQFLQLAVTLPQRRALGLGPPMTEAEPDAWADDCVNLFLKVAASGSRARQDSIRGRPSRTGRSAPDMIYDPGVDQTGSTNDISVSSGWCAR